ncbi:hypothetical protein LCGC14_1609400 [marine sediment metagenome]|uniref:Uncharacterized protein n=1 Tax=marine sediment metagenome TaxID=412755 RepID=A0A0F9I8U0_9ZZZZ
MGITTSAGDGVRINSSAKDNGVLQQAAGLPANQFVMPDSIVDTNNGQITLTTIAGRLIVIRRNEVLEETRYILSEDGDAGMTGTVNEDWDNPPTGGMAYDIAYVVEDAADLTGFTLISKRNRDYSLGRLFSIGNSTTGTFSWFALLDGASIETDNSIGASDRALLIEGDGRWDFGYEQGGAPVPGGYLISTADTTGDWAFETVAGGQFVANSLFLTSVENNRFELDDESRVTVRGLKVYKALYQSIWRGNGLMEDLILQGVNDTNDRLDIDESFDVDGLVLINSYGLYPDGLTTGSVLNYQSVGNTYDVQMLTEGTLLRMFNPTWDGDYPVLNWTASSGTFTEEWVYDNIVQDPTATPLEDARLYLVNDADLSFPLIESSDVQGAISDYILTRNWTSGTAGTLPTFDQTAYTQRFLRFGQTPFEAAVTVTAPIDQTVTLIDDAGVELSEANADLVSGTVYEHGTGTPSNLIAFDNGTVLFSAGDIVVGVSSGATGTVRDKTGDAADGTVYIVDRNAIAFQDGEDLNVAGSPNATANLTSGTGGLDLDFHWEVRASDESLADMYSWQASKSAKASPLGWVYEMLRHRTQLAKRSGGDYWTEREDSEGVFISERGAGSVLYFTSDENWQWTPPTSYTITLNTLKSDSEVRIYQDIGGNPGDELAGTESSSTSFQYSYEHGGSDIPVIIVIFHLDWRDIRLIIDLEAADSTIPITQQTDRVYSNP